MSKKAKKVDKADLGKITAERGAKVYDAVQKRRQMGVLGLVVALVVVLVGSVLFVGAASGWFDDPKVILSDDATCEGGCEMKDVNALEYSKMIEEGESFVMFIDQSGCTTADKLRGFVMSWARENGVRVYRMMFSDARDTSLHDYVKYYPSVVVVARGDPVAWLRADADEDSDAYNKEEAFRTWIGRWL